MDDDENYYYGDDVTFLPPFVVTEDRGPPIVDEVDNGETGNGYGGFFSDDPGYWDDENTTFPGATGSFWDSLGKAVGKFLGTTTGGKSSGGSSGGSAGGSSGGSNGSTSTSTTKTTLQTINNFIESPSGLVILILSAVVVVQLIRKK